jgi:hypothetical protein
LNPLNGFHKRIQYWKLFYWPTDATTNAIDS